MEVFTETIYAPRCSVFFIGDIHEGTKNCDRDALKRAVNLVSQRREERPVIVILMGDIIEAIIGAGDPRFDPSVLADDYPLDALKDLPRIQAIKVINNLKDIRDDIRFALIGNHEEAYIKRHSFNVYDYYVNDLLPNCNKLGFAGMVRMQLKTDTGKGSRSFDIALTHGAQTGGFKPGGAINTVTDVFAWTEADCHVMGHSHKLVAHRIDKVGLGRNGKLVTFPKFYGVSGTFLLSHKEDCHNYFEGRKGTPSEVGILEMQIELDKRMDYGTQLYEWRLA